MKPSTLTTMVDTLLCVILFQATVVSCEFTKDWLDRTDPETLKSMKAGSTTLERNETQVDTTKNKTLESIKNKAQIENSIKVGSTGGMGTENNTVKINNVNKTEDVEVIEQSTVPVGNDPSHGDLKKASTIYNIEEQNYTDGEIRTEQSPVNKNTSQLNEYIESTKATGYFEKEPSVVTLKTKESTGSLEKEINKNNSKDIEQVTAPGNYSEEKGEEKVRTTNSTTKHLEDSKNMSDKKGDTTINQIINEPRNSSQEIMEPSATEKIEDQGEIRNETRTEKSVKISNNKENVTQNLVSRNYTEENFKENNTTAKIENDETLQAINNSKPNPEDLKNMSNKKYNTKLNQTKSKSRNSNGEKDRKNTTNNDDTDQVEQVTIDEKDDTKLNQTKSKSRNYYGEKYLKNISNNDATDQVEQATIDDKDDTKLNQTKSKSRNSDGEKDFKNITNNDDTNQVTIHETNFSPDGLETSLAKDIEKHEENTNKEKSANNTNIGEEITEKMQFVRKGLEESTPDSVNQDETLVSEALESKTGGIFKKNNTDMDISTVTSNPTVESAPAETFEKSFTKKENQKMYESEKINRSSDDITTESYKIDVPNDDINSNLTAIERKDTEDMLTVTPDNTNVTALPFDGNIDSISDVIEKDTTTNVFLDLLNPPTYNSIYDKDTNNTSESTIENISTTVKLGDIHFSTIKLQEKDINTGNFSNNTINLEVANDSLVLSIMDTTEVNEEPSEDEDIDMIETVQPEISTKKSRPKTIFIIRDEDPNYISPNDKNFLYYPNLRKIPSEINTPNKFTVAPKKKTRPTRATRPSSTWMTFPTSPKTTKAIINRAMTTTKPKYVGSLNSDKVPNPKPTRKPVHSYQNYDPAKFRQNDAIKDQLKFVIECKSNGNHTQKATCLTDKENADIFANRLYKLSGDPRYDTKLDKKLKGKSKI